MQYLLAIIMLLILGCIRIKSDNDWVAPITYISILALFLWAIIKVGK